MAVHAGNHDHDGNEEINKEQHVLYQNKTLNVQHTQFMADFFTHVVNL